MAPKRKFGRPKKKTKGPILGKATILAGPLWQAWLQHVLREGPTWLYVALFLSHMLCCRITEILKLAAGDFLWRSKSVQIAAMKGGPSVNKHMLSAIYPKLLALKKSGIKRKRTKHQGARGKVTYMDEWLWPDLAKGLLFRSTRSDSGLVRRNKDAVCRAVCRLRKTFEPPAKFSCDTHRIRSHSGRHTMVNNFKVCNVHQDVGMRMARIADARTWDQKHNHAQAN